MEARLCFLGHALMENRSGLLVSAFCAELPENPEGTASALERMRAFRSQLGFKE